MAGISYEVLKALAHSESRLARILRWPGMQMQRLTTRPPTNEMLEVAIVSMNVALHGLPKGCETTPEGYTVIRDYRVADPAYTPPAAEEADTPAPADQTAESPAEQTAPEAGQPAAEAE